ncbi:hypothetical protein BJ742DRAFT_849614 [Cladochytrium replicatum]|nr:hypothetical protein BJ742DRAFT_849614 [Cladochytrium replicatum]
MNRYQQQDCCPNFYFAHVTVLLGWSGVRPRVRCCCVRTPRRPAVSVGILAFRLTWIDWSIFSGLFPTIALAHQQLLLTKLSEDLLALFRNAIAPDVVLVAGGTVHPRVVFTAHRCILAARCEFFRGLVAFESGKQHASINDNGVADNPDNLPSVELPEDLFHPQAVPKLLEFLYGGCLPEFDEKSGSSNNDSVISNKQSSTGNSNAPSSPILTSRSSHTSSSSSGSLAVLLSCIVGADYLVLDESLKDHLLSVLRRRITTDTSVLEELAVALDAFPPNADITQRMWTMCAPQFWQLWVARTPSNSAISRPSSRSSTSAGQRKPGGGFKLILERFEVDTAQDGDGSGNRNSSTAWMMEILRKIHRPESMVCLFQGASSNVPVLRKVQVAEWWLIVHNYLRRQMPDWEDPPSSAISTSWGGAETGQAADQDQNAEEVGEDEIEESADSKPEDRQVRRIRKVSSKSSFTSAASFSTSSSLENPPLFSHDSDLMRPRNRPMYELTREGRQVWALLLPSLPITSLPAETIQAEIEPMGLLSERQLLDLYRHLAIARPPSAAGVRVALGPYSQTQPSFYLPGFTQAPFPSRSGSGDTTSNGAEGNGPSTTPTLLSSSSSSSLISGNATPPLLFMHCPTSQYSTCALDMVFTHGRHRWVVQVLKSRLYLWVGVVDSTGMTSANAGSSSIRNSKKEGANFLPPLAFGGSLLSSSASSSSLSGSNGGSSWGLNLSSPISSNNNSNAGSASGVNKTNNGHQPIDLSVWAGKQAGGYVLGSNAFLCHNTGVDNGPYTHHFGQEWNAVGSVVECVLDMEERTLGYVINGVDYGVAFRGLPEGGVSPCFSCNHEGLVSVRFVEEEKRDWRGGGADSAGSSGNNPPWSTW